MLDERSQRAIATNQSSDLELRQLFVLSNGLEIETPFSIHPIQIAFLEAKLESFGFKISTSQPVSLYLDGKDSPIARRTFKSFRFRDGGISSDGEPYDPVLCVKSRHEPLQELSNRLTRAHPLYKLRKYRVTPPLIRTELEVFWDVEKDGLVIPFTRFPDVLQREICTRMPYAEAKSITVSPNMASHVPERRKTKLFFDPDNKNDFPYYPAPTAQMLLSGRFVCIEIAIDPCRFVDLEKFKDPDKILLLSRIQFRGVRSTREETIFEPEYKAEFSGRNTSAEMIVDAKLQIEFYARGWLLQQKIRKPSRSYRVLLPNNMLMPSPSKFALGKEPQIPRNEVQQFMRLAS